MWVAQAAKYGYRWIIGDGTKIKFWEDIWFGSTSLVVHFWPLYIICNDCNATIAEVWDGHNLMLTFKRSFDQRMMDSWYDLEQVASSIVLRNDTDAMIWRHTASGTYTSSSLYSIINFRRVKQIYIPSIWSVIIPPKVQVFLWLVSHNKIMTRDNLKKRKMNKQKNVLSALKKNL